MFVFIIFENDLNFPIQKGFNLNNNLIHFLFAEKSMIMYYVEIVPTDIETFASHIKTYQYSVKENTRIISKFVVIECRSGVG